VSFPARAQPGFAKIPTNSSSPGLVVLNGVEERVIHRHSELNSRNCIDADRDLGGTRRRRAALIDLDNGLVFDVPFGAAAGEFGAVLTVPPPQPPSVAVSSAPMAMPILEMRLHCRIAAPLQPESYVATRTG